VCWWRADTLNGLLAWIFDFDSGLIARHSLPLPIENRGESEHAN